MRAVLKRKSTWVGLALAVLLFALFWSDRRGPPPNRGSGQRMKAVIYRAYGTAEILSYGDVEKPLPNPHQVLIQVRAAAVNPLDWHYMRGTPYVMRIGGTGLFSPHDTRLGTDVAGRVESVGSQVTRFKPGDEVFGASGGAFAEYAPASENQVALKPPGLTFEQAAAVPVAALTALQGLRDKGRIRAGQKVLINGASGGVGTFAVQIAKLFGADVTGVCSTRNLSMVTALGADHVIDYTREDFTAGKQKYDLILDNVGNHSLSALRRIMNARAVYVLVGGGGPDGGNWLGPLAGPIKEWVLSPFVSQQFVMVLASIEKDDLAILRQWLEAKKLTPVIDRTFPLNEVPAAIRYLEAGHARGKVIITVPSGN